MLQRVDMPAATRQTTGVTEGHHRLGLTRVNIGRAIPMRRAPPRQEGELTAEARRSQRAKGRRPSAREAQMFRRRRIFAARQNC
jgi:hypothetical protein